MSHTLWQASITSEFGRGIAEDIGFAHEENPNSNWIVDYTKKYFGTLEAVDERIDLTNNSVGRSIGESNKGLGMKDLALKVLDVFKKDGLWTAQRQPDGSFRMVQSKITQRQYNALQQVFERLNEHGFTTEEEKEREEEERKRNGSAVK